MSPTSTSNAFAGSRAMSTLDETPEHGPMSTGGREIQFWDHSKRLDWFMMRAVTRKILERPEILGEMRVCIERYWGGDGSKTRSLRLWRKVLALSPEEFTCFALSDTPEAEETRESFPPYVALTLSERADFIAAARKEVAVA